MKLHPVLPKLAVGAVLLFTAACDGQSGGASDAQAPANTNASVDWPLHGNTPGEQRFSTLEQITPENVADLGVAWYADINARTLRGVEATPVVVDGVMYVSGPWSVVMAVNAASGEVLWEFDPEVPGASARKACCDVVNRGVAVANGKVYVGTIDGRLIALDAATGSVVWSKVTVDQTMSYTITAAPRVAAGHVIIGNSGAEYGVRGYITAYDLDTGEQAWRFYTVPGNPADGFENDAMKMAAETWTGEWWTYGGGGTVWDSMAYDPDLDLLYVGVGNGAPWNVSVRSPEGGDNLFLSSIVALKASTGEYVWHYQTTPGDQWDYTATQHMILTDMDIDGQSRKVIMQAPKNGFFYILDRETGQFLSATPYVPVNWADGTDPETGRPNVVPSARYSETGEVHVGQPSPAGGHGWQPMSFNPQTGLVYFPVRDIAYPYTALDAKDFHYKPGTWNTGEDPSRTPMPEDPMIREQIRKSVTAKLIAWDPVAQKEVWSVPMETPWNGGTLSTSGGLVFQGNGEGYFVAYRATDGEKLWTSEHLSSGIVAAPVSYSVDGEQYVSVAVGWGGILTLNLGELISKGSPPAVNRVVTFKLGGTAELPKVAYEKPPLDPPASTASDEEINHGRLLFHTFCWMCHGDTAVNHGGVPDLRYSATLGFKDVFKAFPIDGAAEENGMPNFSRYLSEEDAEAIRAYLIKRANDLKANPGIP